MRLGQVASGQNSRETGAIVPSAVSRPPGLLLLRLAGGTPRPEDLPVEAAEPVEVEAATAVKAAGPRSQNRTVIDKKRLEVRG